VLVAEHQVVFARDQHLDEEQHRTLANQLCWLARR
jgi:hypothetical protein